jgi:hypothetical protein
MNGLGTHLEADALRALVNAADGYPFFLQDYGEAAWDVSSSKSVNLDNATLAIAIGTEQLDAGILQISLAAGNTCRTAVPTCDGGRSR